MVFVWVAGCVASCRSAACRLVRVAVGAGVLASRGLGNQRQPPAGGWSPPRRADRCDTQALENARSGFCSQGVKRVPLRPADRLSAGWSSAHGGLISCSVRRLGDRHQTEFYGSGWVSRSQGPNSCPLTNRANALHRVCVLRRIEARLMAHWRWPHGSCRPPSLPVTDGSAAVQPGIGYAAREPFVSC